MFMQVFKVWNYWEYTGVTPNVFVQPFPMSQILFGESLTILPAKISMFFPSLSDRFSLYSEIDVWQLEPTLDVFASGAVFQYRRQEQCKTVWRHS